MEAMVSLSGYAGGDVLLTQTRAGDAKAKFRLAVTPRTVRDGAWSDLETIWFSVECYRALAENVTASVHRGDPVVVSGKIRTYLWTDEEHKDHTRTVVVAQSVGHDLAKGTTQFCRPTRARAGDDPLTEPPDDGAEDAVEDGRLAAVV